MSYEDVVFEAATISDKIRKLDKAGLPRAEIARLLGKRYQHVRNVLEADKAQARSKPDAPRPLTEPQGPSPRTTRVGDVVRMTLGDDLSVQLPADLAAEFGFRPGSVLIGEIVGETIVIPSRAENIRRVQESVRRYVPEGVSLVDELIAELRLENAKDERGE